MSKKATTRRTRKKEAEPQPEAADLMPPLVVGVRANETLQVQEPDGTPREFCPGSNVVSLTFDRRALLFDEQGNLFTLLTPTAALVIARAITQVLCGGAVPPPWIVRCPRCGQAHDEALLLAALGADQFGQMLTGAAVPPICEACGKAIDVQTK
jgi:hypothetical protein